MATKGELAVDSGGYDWSMSFCTCDQQTLHCDPPVKLMPNDHRRRMDAVMRTYFGMRQSSRSKFGRFRDALAFFFSHLVPLLCWPPCPDSIISKMALFHLDRASYEFVQFGSRKKNDYRLGLSIAAHMFARLYSRRYLAYFGQLRCFFIDDKHGGHLACIYASGYTPILPMVEMAILFFHSNGSDLGLAAGYTVRLCRRFSARVLTVEYPGFGFSTGPCGDEKFYESAEIAYDYLTKKMGIPADQIVIIGTSLGVAAAVHVASRRPVKAVVLQGAFLSAFRVVCPFKRPVSRCDRFLNVDKIRNVHAPTLIVHGKKDEYFPLRHARLLRDSCPGAAKIEPFYVDNAGHMDFDESIPYWVRLHKFLHYEVASLAEDVGCCGQKVEETTVRAKWNEFEELRGAYTFAVMMKSFPPERKENPRFPIILCEPCLAMATKRTTEATTEPSPGSSSTPTKSPSPGPSPTPKKSPSPGPSPTPKKSPSPGPSPTPKKSPSPGPSPTPKKSPSCGKNATLTKAPSSGKNTTLTKASTSGKNATLTKAPTSGKNAAGK